MNIENLDLELDLENDFPEDQVEETTDENETEDEGQEEDEPIEETETKEEPDALAKATYNRLVAQGLLDEDPEFAGTFEDIEERLEDVPKRLLNQAIEELPQNSQAMLKFIAAAGTNITPQEIYDFAKTVVNETQTSFETLDEAKSFMETKLKAQGLKDRAIQAEIEELEDSDELLDKANKLLAEDNKKSQKLIENKEEQNRQIQESQKQFVSAIGEELKTLNYSKRKEEQIRSTMPKSNQILSDVVKSPKAYIQLIDFLSKFKNNEFDLSDYLKQGASKATSDLREALNKTTASTGTKTTGTVMSKYIKDDRYIPTID